MDSSDLLFKIIETLKSVKNLSDVEIDKNTRFNDLNISSLDFIKFIIQVEKALIITVDDAMLSLSNYDTIGDFLDYVSTII